MIIRYATKPNTNGNSYQVEIDNEQKTIKAGYFIFIGKGEIIATKKQLQAIIKEYEQNGYKRI